ncbi:hypothetical protein HJFPF1_11710 [Paramyrothecium foliicola]|nr:hypothetical protein HJFPF1_11710 [Paramyrothecium foliicola]
MNPGAHTPYNMLDEESRYFCLSGDIPTGGPSTWHIVDWDQRRTISVTMDGEQDDEDLAVHYLHQYSDKIPLSIYRVYVSETGDLVASFNSPDDDQTYCMFYPLLQDVHLPSGTQTIRRNEIEELLRFGPDADLVAYSDAATGETKTVVFKYYFIWQYGDRSWNEMNIWMRLPSHSNIVPFDRVVLDEIDGRVIGFTNQYFAGGSLEENDKRTFQFEWLQQLIHVVDDLNLKYSIAHQDIAPRNLLIDDSTNTIKLFDFNFAARINCPSPIEGEHWIQDRNDVKGVIFTAYEIITRDTTLRGVPHEEQSYASIPKVWNKHPEVHLDRPVEAYRQLLQTWQQKREADVFTSGAARTCETMELPTRPKPPLITRTTTLPSGEVSSWTTENWFERRQEILARGGQILNWERPALKHLDKTARLLCTGEIIKEVQN